MNYIVFDMEWNQPYPGEKIIYKNDLCINNEIIQIGAVKLDEKCNIIDTFSINIKPSVFRKLNHNVRKLTGIEPEMLEISETFEPSMEKFKKWCGCDFVFVSWGYDDIGVLGTNLKYFSVDTSWLPECYNLQMIFCSQTDNENRQYSLCYAAEYFNITMDKPLHNALTDAYYTALVCSKLDMKKGISGYRAMVFKDKSIPEHMKNIIYKRNHPAVNGYNKLLEKCGIVDCKCYECQNSVQVLKKANNGLYNYLIICRCKMHGEFALIYKINKVSEDSYNAVEQCFKVDKYNKNYFIARAKKMISSDRKRKRCKNRNTGSKMVLSLGKVSSAKSSVKNAKIT